MSKYEVKPLFGRWAVMCDDEALSVFSSESQAQELLKMLNIALYNKDISNTEAPTRIGRNKYQCNRCYNISKGKCNYCSNCGVKFIGEKEIDNE